VGELFPTRRWACWPMVLGCGFSVEAGIACWCVGYSSRAQRRYRRSEDGSLQAIPDCMAQVLGIRTPPCPRSLDLAWGAAQNPGQLPPALDSVMCAKQAPLGHYINRRF
jgi:hypothetical protein